MRATRTAVFGLVAVVCLTAAGSSGMLAQVNRPDAVAIISTYAATGRADYRFQSSDEAQAWIEAWPAGVDRWIQAGDPDDAERRTHIAALAAFEFAHTAFDALSGSQYGASATLIEAAHSHLRRSPPGDFERRWLRATTGSLVASRYLLGPVAHTADAAERFPDDPRLRINLVLADRDSVTLAREPGTPEARLAQSLGHGDRATSLNRRSPSRVGRAEPVFTALLDDPEVGAEAKARLGWLRFHQNKVAESVALFNNALSASDDPFVANLAALGLGLAHLAEGRHDEATLGFRAAKAALPTARASTTALAMQLFLAGQRQEASELLDRLAGIPNTLDPWTQVTGADRFVNDIVRELRAELGVPARVVPADPPRDTSPALQVQPPPADVDAAGAAPTAPQRSAAARPIFSATTAIVSVDAAVLNGRRPVEGLGPADFEIRDNGVLQTIEDVSIDGVPLDVSVVLDLRDPGYGVYSREHTTVVRDATSQGVADTAQFSALLRPDDRLRIVTATRDVAEPHPLQGPNGRAAHRVLREVATASALHDAMFTALARTTPPNRRHLVLVFTDGLDGSSIVTSAQLLQAAGISDALVRVFRRDTAREFFQRSRVGNNNDAMSEFLLWPHDPSLLPSVAETTSGSLERVSSTGQSVVADVKRTLESFRQRYVLRYRPTGVEPGGWHDITVRVTRPGRLTVEARRGYFGG